MLLSETSGGTLGPVIGKRLLIVDDEQRIREVVEYALSREGFVVTAVADGRSALERVAAESFDLVLLDVTLPDLDGLGICREIRKTSSVPVVFLSARGEELDRVLGLELGGDDYLVKPFSPRELVARINAVLRRAEPRVVPVAATAVSVEPPDSTTQQTKRLVHGSVTVDLERYEVKCGVTVIQLTRTEFGVLAALLERPGIVLARSQLMERAYAYDNLITERTIDTHVRRIRAKFRPCAIDPISTVHGVGYKAFEP